MPEPIHVYVGDKCPECHQALIKVQPPSARQLEAATRRDDPFPLNPHVDRMSEADRAEHGDLYRCTFCTFEDRLKPKPE